MDSKAITDTVVRQLLDTFITPKYEDIVDYDITTEEYMGGVFISIHVVLKHKIRYDMTMEYEIERKIKDSMKYLSPFKVSVEFYVTNDY
jgi:hypothetical protein